MPSECCALLFTFVHKFVLAGTIYCTSLAIVLWYSVLLETIRSIYFGYSQKKKLSTLFVNLNKIFYWNYWQECYQGKSAIKQIFRGKNVRRCSIITFLVLELFLLKIYPLITTSENNIEWNNRRTNFNSCFTQQNLHKAIGLYPNCVAVNGPAIHI